MVPVFVSVTVYVSTSPTLTVPLPSPSALPVSAFTSVCDVVCGTGVSIVVVHPAAVLPAGQPGPVATAVLRIVPASASDWLTVYVPTNWQVAPGATLAQVTLDGVIRASLTNTFASVVVPVFVSVTVYVSTSPTLTVPLPSPSALPVSAFTSVCDVVCGTGVSIVVVHPAAVLPAGQPGPVATAVLRIVPASASDWLTVYVPTNWQVAPGATLAQVTLDGVIRASLTNTFVSVVVPVFVSVTVYVSTSPTLTVPLPSPSALPVSAFTSVCDVVCGTGVSIVVVHPAAVLPAGQPGPVATAVLRIVPASASDWLTVYVPTNWQVAPGATLAQVTLDGVIRASLTNTFVSVVVPVFVSVTVYVSTSPTLTVPLPSPSALPVSAFTSVCDVVCGTGVSIVVVHPAAVLPAGQPGPVATAVLRIVPASASDWLTVYVPTNWQVAPGATLAQVTLDGVIRASLTNTFVSVVVPVFVSVTVYVSTSPTLTVPLPSPSALPVSAFTSVCDVVCGTGVSIVVVHPAAVLPAGQPGPVATAVLRIVPASASDWLTVYVPTNWQVAPGATLAQVTLDGVIRASLTNTFVSVVVPVFVSVTVYVSTSPTLTVPLPSPSALPVSAFTSVCDVVCGTGVSIVVVHPAAVLPAGQPGPVATAVLRIVPASASDWLTVYVPTNWQVAPGATLAQVTLDGVIRASLTNTFASVVLPVFVSVTVYVSTSPTLTVPLPSPSALPVSAFTSVCDVVCGTGVSIVVVHPAAVLPAGQPGPVATAVLRIVPASASDWLTVYVPTNWQVAPGATLAQVTLDGVIRASLTNTFVSVVVPVFVSVTVYVSTSPTLTVPLPSPSALPVSAFTSVCDVVCGTGVSIVVVHPAAVLPAGQPGPVATAVLRIVPASASDWLTVYVPTNWQVAPGATLAQVTLDGVIRASLTNTFVSVVVPVFVSVTVYVSTSPTLTVPLPSPSALPVSAFTSVCDVVWSPVAVAVASAEVVVPSLAEATFVTEPASMSPCVIV